MNTSFDGKNPQVTRYFHRRVYVFTDSEGFQEYTGNVSQGSGGVRLRQGHQNGKDLLFLSTIHRKT